MLFSPASPTLFFLRVCAWYFWYFLFWGWNFLKSWSIRAAACNGDLLVDRCAVFLEVSPDSVVRNRACRAVHWVCASSCSRVHDNSDQSVQWRGIMRRRACFWIRRRTCNFVPSKFHVREESIWILVEPLPYCFSPASSILFPVCFSLLSFHAHYFLFEADIYPKIWSIRAAACNGGLLVDRCAMFLEVSLDSVVRNRACRAVHWVRASVLVSRLLPMFKIFQKRISAVAWDRWL